MPLLEPVDPIEQLRKEVAEIRARNARVESEKAWETSWTRRLLIGATTWVAAWLWLVSLDVGAAAKHAIVPSAAYLISTFSLPVVRNWWLRIRLR